MDQLTTLTPQSVFFGVAALTGGSYLFTSFRRRRHFARAFQQAEARAQAFHRR
jgi:hypothetical protein